MASIGLSFLKVLENPSMGCKNLEAKEEVYVHPMMKRSASALSSKSLEMCTESLGSETGSDVSESGDEFCPIISLEERERLRAIQKSKYRNFGRKVRRNDFPPPLTSISGSDGAVKVNHHREGGRLVIKAVSFSNCGTSFQTERTNGRLRLSLLRDRSVVYESEGVEMENYESERVEMEKYENERVEMENYEEGGEVEYEEEEAEEEEEEGGTDGSWRWDMSENQWRMAGKREVKMLTRCKEGGNGNKVFTNWGSSWGISNIIGRYYGYWMNLLSLHEPFLF
ncbi:putative The fantastic four family protein [Helianthus annuus]|nr:putative The fantastic four family protein [Helianthus annuus]